MKNLTDYINEMLNENKANEMLNTTEEVKVDEAEVNEGKISSEEDFRAAAKAKFEETFGDDLDENKMNDTIDGLLKDNADLVKDDKWGELMGMLNKSFAA